MCVQRTWDNESLAAHDEDDLHRPELLQPQLPPRVQSKSQLRHENDAEEADADGGCDVRGAAEPLEGREVFCSEDVLGIFDDQGKAEADR